ncbi:MAG: forkhead box transcription factor [Thermoanaerobacteraceae bacterium]|nr:forkhead box transcription factor [Thermoanaerobacteraceae bacterium]
MMLTLSETYSFISERFALDIFKQCLIGMEFASLIITEEEIP